MSQNEKSNRENHQANLTASNEDEIALDCARECITHAMAICSAYLADQRNGADPTGNQKPLLENALAQLQRKQQSLRLASPEIADIRRTYGGLVREHATAQRNATQWLTELAQVG